MSNKPPEDMTFRQLAAALSKAEREQGQTLEELHEALEELEAPVTALEVVKAHVVTDWIEYPNGRVGLDAVGNIARIELDDSAQVDR